MKNENMAGEIAYRELGEGEISMELFHGFIRRQEVTLCWRKENGTWVVKEAPFIDDWTREDYEGLVKELKETAKRGGLVLGAFEGERLKGFAAAGAEFFGRDGQYLDLIHIYVSQDRKGRGIGRRLFSSAASWAGEKGAKKLYISAHSAVESQAFYRAVGCVEAEEYDRAHVEKEPFDCQLEYAL